MISGRKTKLAAPFVVSVVTASALGACRKQTVATDPEVQNGRESAYVHRNGDRCTMSIPEHCPKGASCNPPPPTEIDCPANLRDAGEPEPPKARPPGKEDWLRVKPKLWASQYGCGYTAEHFCAPPPRPYECTPQPAAVTLKCKGIALNDLHPDKPSLWRVEPFVFKDGLGLCHKIPEIDCKESDCTAQMPAGDSVPCPP